MLHSQALEIEERILGSMHPYVAYTLRSLGVLAHRQGDLKKAEAYLRKALSIQREVHGVGSATVARTFNDLGAVLEERGEYAEAHEVYEEMLRIDRRVFPSDNPMIGRDISKLGSLSLAQGNLDAAKELYRQALAILPASELITSEVNVGYARLLLELGELGKAEQAARDAFQQRKSRLPLGHSFTAEAQSILGAVLAKAGRNQEAIKLLKAAYHVLHKRARPGDIYYEQTKEILARFD